MEVVNTSAPGWSPDGHWFWDGLKWNDALSPDGRWRFDGREWQAFSGQRSSMPAQPPGQAPVQPPPPEQVVLPSWVAQSEADRLEQERREMEALVAQAAVPVAPLHAESHLIRNVLLWAGLVLGAGIFLFGLLGIISLSLSSTARSGSVAVAVVLVIFGAAVLIACLLRLLGYSLNLGPVGMAISSLGVLGCVVVLLMIINTLASLGHTGGGRYVIPWATVLVVVRRAWKGRWLAVVIISVTWVVGVLVTTGRF